MVPWHLQPKYSSGSGDVETLECVKSSCSKKQQRRRQRKGRQHESCKETRCDVLGTLAGDQGLTASLSGKGEEKSQAGMEPKQVAEARMESKLVPVVGMEPKQVAEAGMEPKQVSEARIAQQQQMPEIGTEQDLIPQAGTGCKQLSSSREHKAGLSEQGYTTYQRYYHVFRKGELVDVVLKVSALQVQEQFYDHENWCVVAVKM